jgi:hypothetical protein
MLDLLRKQGKNLYNGKPHLAKLGLKYHRPNKPHPTWHWSAAFAAPNVHIKNHRVEPIYHESIRQPRRGMPCRRGGYVPLQTRENAQCGAADAPCMWRECSRCPHDQQVFWLEPSPKQCARLRFTTSSYSYSLPLLQDPPHTCPMNCRVLRPKGSVRCILVALRLRQARRHQPGEHGPGMGRWGFEEGGGGVL